MLFNQKPLSSSGALGLSIFLSNAVPTLAQANTALFVLTGGSPLVIERLDPVISAGKVSGHVHSIAGGNAFAPTMDFALAQSSTCSTEQPIADKSNYWTPNVYFHDPTNGSYIRAPDMPHKLYYKSGGNTGAYDPAIKEFPSEFRMMSGNPDLRSLTSDDAGNNTQLNWQCHPGVSGYSATPNFPPDLSQCYGGLAATIRLPSCWNGEPFNASDPYAHMAFEGQQNGMAGCPASHSVARFPVIMIEYSVNITQFDGLYDPTKDQPFVLSNGDPTGCGFHFDFINGWDEGVLNDVMPTCIDGTGLDADTCFGPHGGIRTPDEQLACRISPVVEEDVGWTPGTTDGDATIGGVLTENELPGCNPIQSGPGLATAVACTSTPTIVGGQGTSLPSTVAAASSTAGGMGMSNATAHASSMSSSSAMGSKGMSTASSKSSPTTSAAAMAKNSGVSTEEKVQATGTAALASSVSFITVTTTAMFTTTVSAASNATLAACKMEKLKTISSRA